MNKLCLVLLGALAIAAIASAWDHEEDASLSEDLTNSRLVRSPEAEAKRRRKGRKNNGKGKNPKRSKNGKRSSRRKSKKRAGKSKKGTKSKRRGGKSKKGTKSKRRGGKSKKGTKSKRRGGKSKKGTKLKKRGGKSQKGTKTKNRRTKSGSNSRMSGKAVSDTCFENALTIMRMWKDVISNFERQKKRMERQNSTGVNKSGKKGIFGPIAQRLIEVGGGNKSAPSCGGKTNNDGAKQLKNLTDTLSACESNVHKMCGNFSQPNMTKLSACAVLADSFKKGAQKCLDLTIGSNAKDTDTACTCWTGADLNKTVQAAKNCKFSTEAKAIANELKNCTKAFGKCRKYEDAAVTAITNCTKSSSGSTLAASTTASTGKTSSAGTTRATSTAASTGTTLSAGTTTATSASTLTKQVSF